VLAAAGIKVIKYQKDYKNDPLVFELLNEAGVAILKN
jgi:deoxycytidylate deaminase